MDSCDSSIRNLLMSRGYLFKVPNYQRSFVWEQDEINEFLKDITYCYEQNNNGKTYEHFFGQMVLRIIEEDRANRTIFEIVDGQQRLTTVTLTISALYRLILKYADVSDPSVLSYLRTLKNNYLISTPDQGSCCRILELSKIDNPVLVDVATVAENRIIDDFTYECTRESQERIVKAFNQIMKYLEHYFSNEPLEKYAKTLTNFADVILQSISIVIIKPKTIGYSYALYQIVNDRGVLLTSAELLKARTLELLRTNDVLFQESESIWDDILNDPGNETTKYLVWHFSSIMHKTPTKNKLHEQYEKNLFNCFSKREINSNEQEELSKQIKSLYESVKWCRKLSKGTLPVDGLHPQIQDMFYSLVCGLKNEIAIPIFLNILRIANQDNKVKTINFITFLISRFFFSCKTICNIHNGSITKIYNEISAKIANGSIFYDDLLKICKDEQVKKNVANTFAAKMDDTIYSKTNTTPSKYLLYFLEFFHNTNNISVSEIIARDESICMHFDKISSEHIGSYSGLDGNALTENQRNTLGNLTILGKNINNDLDSKPFIEKRAVYANSPYIITRDIASNSKWECEEYDNRQAKLKTKATEIFIIN